MNDGLHLLKQIATTETGGSPGSSCTRIQCKNVIFRPCTLTSYARYKVKGLKLQVFPCEESLFVARVQWWHRDLCYCCLKPQALSLEGKLASCVGGTDIIALLSELGHFSILRWAHNSSYFLSNQRIAFFH